MTTCQTVEVRSPSGAAAELDLAHAVDAVQALAGPGPQSCDLLAVLTEGGTLQVSGWTFTGTTHQQARGWIGSPSTVRHDARLARAAAWQVLYETQRSA